MIVQKIIACLKVSFLVGCTFRINHFIQPARNSQVLGINQEFCLYIVQPIRNSQALGIKKYF